MSSTSRRGPGRPAASDPVPTADEILQHALRAFVEQGYEAVSVSRLGIELGMGRTFVSDRYGAKEALWRAVVEHAMGRMIPEVAAELEAPSKDDLERLVAAIRAWHGAAARHADFARLIDQEARVASDRLTHLYALIRPYNDAIRALFDRLVDDGRLRPMPWYLFYFLATAPVSLYSQPPLARLLGRPDDAEDHDLMTELVLGGLLAPGATDG